MIDCSSEGQDSTGDGHNGAQMSLDEHLRAQLLQSPTTGLGTKHCQALPTLPHSST